MMSGRRPSHALFDFADTLAELEPARQALVAAYVERESGIRIPEDLILRAYKAVDLLHPYSSVRIRTSQRRSDFYIDYNCRLLSLLGVLHAVSAEGLYAYFVECEKHWHLKPDVKATIEALRGKGLRIGVISNFDSSLTQIIHRVGLSGLIDDLHVSQTEGVEKPDTAFYLDFFERHAIDIGQSLYVGDSYVLDFLPAQRIGLEALLLDEGGLYKHCPFAIGRVGEMLDVLKSRGV